MVSNSMWCHTNITGEVRERERERESLYYCIEY